MERDDVEKVILERLNERGKKVVNRNAWKSFFAAFPNPINALGKIFFGRGEALDAEKKKIMQDIMIDLLCKIDDALSESQNTASKSGVDWIKLSGLIEATAIGGDTLTGVSIGADSGMVEFKSGTHVKVTAVGTKNVTGVKIGGNGSKGGS